MPRQNRVYNKNPPIKKPSLFVIIAEGVREDRYFSWFNARNSQIQILIIDREGQASSPNRFVERLNKAESEGKYLPDEGDQVWFICDVDRWRRQIDDLRTTCEQISNWNVAVSNPCFEVWLHFHSGAITISPDSECRDLKSELPNLSLGQFNPHTYCPNIENAIRYSKIADSSQNTFFPDTMQTKIYLLAEKMLEVLGTDW